MPLPQHQNDITWSRRRHGEPDGVSPRIALVNLTTALHSFKNLTSNVRGVLRSRIVISHDDDIRPTGRRAHIQSLLRIAVSPGTDDNDHSSLSTSGSLTSGRGYDLLDRIRRVCVVHDVIDAVLASDEFHPAWDSSCLGCVRSNVERNAHTKCRDDCHGGIRDNKVGTHRSSHVAGVDSIGQHPPAIDSGHIPVGRSTGGTDRLEGNSRLPREALSPLVIDQHNSPPRTLLCEELRLGGEVGLHSRVIVQMIVAEARENGHVKDDAIDSMLAQRNTRDFHDDGLRSAVHHRPGHRLDVGCFGCRAWA